ncbi:MAG TPA: polysaccharide pyruvyl transferase family protein [Clostridiales bacterium]|jgi:colanic acid/amylovoran biosynthesis protein|nr:polysaccharide pyruvyl transferase family protein [Clostridiales bacterium]
MHFTLYANGSSKNHGCEAIWRSTLSILELSENEIFYLSPNPEDEVLYGNPVPSDRLIAANIKRSFVVRAVNKVSSKLIGRGLIPEKFDTSFYEKPFSQSAVALSCGGDNYCYGKAPLWLAAANRKAAEMGVPTVLWGCSVEPSVLKDPAIVRDLQSYALICARESLTYEALLAAGVDKNTHLYPDPAFCLGAEEGPLPEGFVPGNTVGINVSPLILRLEKDKGTALSNFRALISHILQNTDMHIALIPHVVWPGNDDRKPLQLLYNEFAASGRVCLAEDDNCLRLKGLIGRCRFFVGARTHATIAAYSSMVPTLVAGYSVKARGIAKDLFGTDKHYVVPVQQMTGKNELLEAFLWLYENDKTVRARLEEIMPGYKTRAAAAKEPVMQLVSGR